ncbi:MAG: hypothetical protein IPK13_12705 [Deltaproteobacteria bacterium]|nr:hypothetical protein [Deltaproteobacteria bacterium]
MLYAMALGVGLREHGLIGGDVGDAFRDGRPIALTKFEARSVLGAASGSGSGSGLNAGSIARWAPESSRFTYDAADNFLTVETSAGVMSPSVGADNRYTTFAGLGAGAENVGTAGVGLEMDDLESDADGRLMHLGVITFTYDALGNMVARTDDRDGASWQFRYDAFGQLAGGIDSRGHAFALRRADGWIVEHRDLETGASTTYIPGLEPNTAPLAVVSADDRLVYNHAPWGERVMLTTDDRGRVASSYAWSAYGEPSSTSASSSLSSLSPVEGGANDLLLLGGQPYFAELGLHRFGQRCYAPGLGRFLSQDPLGFLDGANRYLCAGGQPIDFYDPLGLERQRVQRERSRAFMWALRGEQGLRDWDTSRAWGHELMQRHAGDAEYYRRHGHYPGLNPKASVQILKAMVMFPFAMAALASAPLHFAVALGFGEGASSGTGVVLDYAGVENEVVRALIQDTASVAAGSVAFGAAGRLGRTTMTTAEVASSAASAEAVAPTAVSAARGLATQANKAVFWSGIRGGDSTAAAWVGRNGGATLETTLAQRGISLPAWDASNPAVVTAWRNASAEFAAGARGSVRVLQSDAVRVNSVWAEVEFPALRANPSVTSITAVNPGTGAETLLWTR